MVYYLKYDNVVYFQGLIKHKIYSKINLKVFIRFLILYTLQLYSSLKKILNN